MALSPFTQLRPSLMPAAHLPALQVGQGWIMVMQVPPGQSSGVWFGMHPKPAFEPPEHTLVSQVPEPVQSVPWQHGVLAACPLPPRQRPVSLTQLPPGHGVPAAMVPQPPLPVQFAPAFDPPAHRIGMRSPVRKMPELSGRFRSVTLPAAQSALPEALAVSVLITHVLVAAPPFEELGMGSGGPKRHPAVVHLVCVHLAFLQLPLTQEGGEVVGEQSASVLQVLAQSPLTRHDAPRFTDNPCVQRFTPASAGVAPVSVSVVPSHEASVNNLPISGTFDGSGTPTPAPPTPRPPHASGQRWGWPSASR